MKLGYSRYDYWEIVFDQKVETWINCHVKAFRYFCGVPKVIKLDNLKAGVTKVDIYVNKKVKVHHHRHGKVHH
jgi:transposase